ncbi:MAG TPA: hypothetical protein VK662_12110 [Acidothermaceae bacterium]|jgi:hypothetical protein|nr:hypothetical protein [Acidothermaceae bacterium]
MSTKSRLTVAANLVLVATTACVLTACSKSGSSSPAAATGGASTAAAAGASAAAAVSAPAGAAAALAGATGAGGPLDTSKQCAAIKPADVQVLMKAPVTPVVDNPGECSFYGGDLKIDIYPNDPNQKFYQNPVNGPGTTPLTGVGDQAQWFAPVPGATTPWVEAHKGSLTCELSPADVAETTIPYTGSDPFFKIAPADSAAYAAKEGVLCQDIFNAS